MVIETVRSPLQNTENDQTHEPVVFFYCNRNESQRRDPNIILRALVKQMALALPGAGLPKPVVVEYDKRVKRGLAAGPLDFGESHALLVSILDMFPRTTIIIDALDESDPEERGQLLEELTSIIGSSATVVKIFISSRDDIDIKLKLENVPNHYIEARDNSTDIERFIYREIMESSKNKRLIKLPEGLKKEIISTLAMKANGM